MTVDAYLTTAATQLRTAVGELQREIRTIQGDTDRAKWQLKNEASTAETQKATKSIELNTSDDQYRHEVENELLQLDQKAKQKHQQATQMSDAAAGAVQSKTDLINNLQSLASQLDSMAGSTRN